MCMPRGRHIKLLQGSYIVIRYAVVSDLGHSCGRDGEPYGSPPSFPVSTERFFVCKAVWVDICCRLTNLHI